MAAQLQLEQRAQYTRAIFDTIPLPSFIVDADVRVHDFNAAAEKYLGPQPAAALHCRSGEALHCIHSEAAGCGGSESCRRCVIRNSVSAAIAGRATFRATHQVELRGDSGTVALDLLVTSSLLPYTDPPRALLILEDITEILRGATTQTEAGTIKTVSRAKTQRRRGANLN